jgi:urease accessory protein
MPLAISGLTSAAGFVMATAILHLTGIASGILLAQRTYPRLVRAAGALIAGSGIWLMMG